MIGELSMVCPMNVLAQRWFNLCRLTRVKVQSPHSTILIASVGDDSLFAASTGLNEH